MIAAIVTAVAIAVIFSMQRSIRPISMRPGPTAQSFQMSVLQLPQVDSPQVSSISYDAVQPQAGETVFKGVAEKYKVGACVEGAGYVILGESAHWPLAVDGQIVRAVGMLETRYDLPVFIFDPNRESLEGMPSEISKPPGTDLHEASKREVLVVREWAVKPS